MATITDSELLLVSKATQEKLRDFSQGVQLFSRSGKSIKELQARVANGLGLDPLARTGWDLILKSGR